MRLSSPWTIGIVVLGVLEALLIPNVSAWFALLIVVQVGFAVMAGIDLAKERA